MVVRLSASSTSRALPSEISSGRLSIRVFGRSKDQHLAYKQALQLNSSYFYRKCDSKLLELATAVPLYCNKICISLNIISPFPLICLLQQNVAIMVSSKWIDGRYISVLTVHWDYCENLGFRGPVSFLIYVWISTVVSLTHLPHFTPQKHYYFNVSGTHFY
jgi:hypothetical protein